MIKVFNYRVINGGFNTQCVITVDADIDAERVIIMHRDTGDVYYNFKLVDSIRTFVVPKDHSFNNTLLVGIFDDNAVYDCKFVDGVRAENVNDI